MHAPGTNSYPRNVEISIQNIFLAWKLKLIQNKRELAKLSVVVIKIRFGGLALEQFKIYFFINVDRFG